MVSTSDKITRSRPKGYKTFFMLNSAEHEIFSAYKYENANNTKLGPQVVKVTRLDISCESSA